MVCYTAVGVLTDKGTMHFVGFSNKETLEEIEDKLADMFTDCSYNWQILTQSSVNFTYAERKQLEDIKKQ